MHTSADGFVATADGKLWPGFGWPDEVQRILNDLYRDAEAVVYGRGVYEVVVPFWTSVARDGSPDDVSVGDAGVAFADILEPIPKYVVSHDLEPAEAGVRAIRADVLERVGEIVHAASGPVPLLAGGRLAGDLADAGVIDELLLIVGSVALGRGRPLLEVARPLQLQLLSADAVTPDCTIIRYAVAG
jgi:dihydrofolate reductase